MPGMFCMANLLYRYFQKWTGKGTDGYEYDIRVYTSTRRNRTVQYPARVADFRKFFHKDLLNEVSRLYTLTPHGLFGTSL